MVAIKCKKCGSIGYSASEEARCGCGGKCEPLGNHLNGASEEEKLEYKIKELLKYLKSNFWKWDLERS